ncbi:MAG: hypothetical protein AAFU80_07770 [Pseudomonadota bacterium]
MTAIRTISLALVLALTTSAVEAARSFTRAGLSAAGTADRFEVFSRAGVGPASYFCAAGDFARRHLNARASDRVTVVGPLSPSLTVPGRRSVVFAVGPQGRSFDRSLLGDVLLRTGVTGSSRSVGASEALCDAAGRQ